MEIKTVISTGLHKLISNSPPKTERLLSLFLITVISLMSLAMLSVMTQGLKSDLTKHYLQSNEQKSINLARQIDRFLDTRRVQLEAQTQSAVVKQTVMRPDSNKGLINDYFLSQSIIGKKYAQQLYDFKGVKIFSSPSINEQHQSFSLSQHNNTQIQANFHALYEGTNNFEIILNEDLNFWKIVLPIKYGDSIEGILVTHIPVSEMVEALDLNNIIDIQLQATTSNDISIQWGVQNTLAKIRLGASSSGIRLSYGIDVSSLNQSFSDAKKRLIYSALIIAILSTGLAIILGRWFFVRPLERLHVFATELSEGADPHLEKTKRITIEIQRLSDKITEMAKKIHHREQDLIKSNEALKQNQSTLVHAEKMAGLGQVTAGVAHEINNPIGFIMNNLTMLQEYHTFLKTLLSQLLSMKEKLSLEEQKKLKPELDAIADTLTQEDLEFVINDLDCITGESITGTERVKDITQGLKGYAYSGEQTALTDINECIESTLKMVWNELKYHCTVEKSLANLPKVECIGGQINQVFMNLFINASHAVVGSNGQLYIESKQVNNYIQITVTDNGCGIKQEHLKHIFDPFFTTKPVGEGTGLGMSICYDIIKKHGGDISVKSELNVGTTVTIKIPLRQKAI